MKSFPLSFYDLITRILTVGLEITLPDWPNEVVLGKWRGPVPLLNEKKLQSLVMNLTGDDSMTFFTCSLAFSTGFERSKSLLGRLITIVGCGGDLIS